jgi:hypothetical protein
MSVIDKVKAMAFGKDEGEAGKPQTSAPQGAASDGSEPHKSDLQQNAEKALHMKQEAGPQAHIPPHQTAHEGGVQGSQFNYTDTALGKESTYASNLKRSHNARSGDA